MARKKKHPTPRQLTGDSAQLRRAAEAFLQTVPADTREAIVRMAKDKGMTPEALIYEVWGTQIEAWAAEHPTND
jgi:hypothetical protein